MMAGPMRPPQKVQWTRLASSLPQLGQSAHSPCWSAAGGGAVRSSSSSSSAGAVAAGGAARLVVRNFFHVVPASGPGLRVAGWGATVLRPQRHGCLRQGGGGRRGLLGGAARSGTHPCGGTASTPWQSGQLPLSAGVLVGTR